MKRFGYEGLWSCLEHRARHAFTFVAQVKGLMLSALKLEAKENSMQLMRVKFELASEQQIERKLG